MQKYNKYKKQYKKDQQTNKRFDKLYRTSLQDILFNEIEHESLCNSFSKYVDEQKNEYFLLSMNRKLKLNIFKNNKLKFDQKPRIPGT